MFHVRYSGSRTLRLLGASAAALLATATLGACSGSSASVQQGNDAAVAPGATTDASPPSVDAAAAQAVPYAGQSFACDFILQPVVREIVVFDGKEFAGRITASGATRGNAEWKEKGVGELAIESQRSAASILAAGLASEGSDRAALIDKGLLALEWAFAQQGADGSFPEERGGTKAKDYSLHPKSEFIEAAASGLLMLKQCPGVDATFKERAAKLSPKLALSANWLARTPNLEKFFPDAKNTNQVFFPTVALQIASVVLGDQPLADKAKALMADVLARQTADGAFPEDFGFDSSYQTVSIDLLTNYAATIADPVYRKQLLDAGQRGVDRFLVNVRPDGTIDTSTDTRTGVCGAPVPGNGPKGKSIDVIPLRIYQFGYFAGTSAKLAPIAQSILSAGQGFDHEGSCTD